MLSYIYRLIRNFENDHGIHPNLLHLNQEHISHLKTAFEETMSLQDILALLEIELIIEFDIMHPHVSWSSIAHEKVAC